MQFLRISRRKKLTLLKLILIGLAILSVLFWFTQVWDVATSSEIDEKHPRHPERSEIVHTADKNSVYVKNSEKTLLKFGSIDAPSHQQSKDNNLQIKAPINLKKSPRPSPQTSVAKEANENQISKDFIDNHMKVTPGLGEMGTAVILPAHEQKLADEEFSSAAFNVYISDRISLNRSVPNSRSLLCDQVQYDKDLPTASVIIIFTNEAWSALLRTVYSVFNRSPKLSLSEIILVDDFSDKENLKTELKPYMEAHFPHSMVKLLRLNKRQGLIRARLAGAKIATGDVLVFLDAHCEVNNQWLEPLLHRIKEDRKAVLCPIIDVIDDKTLQYYDSNKDYFQIGGFTWSGHFTWIEIPKSEDIRRGGSVIAPTRTPTMAGGLFAIDRSYFWEIGSYDREMDIWGGENLELSFRVWLCGGTLEIIPCSRVGHIFRSFHPYSFPGDKDSHGINTVRTVEVWMDDYKKYFYMYRKDLKSIDYGDISERLDFKKKLKCKPFEWFLQNIYPEKFIMDKNVTAFGAVRNPVTNFCLDVLNREEKENEPLGLYQCNPPQNTITNQAFSLSNVGELRREEACAEVDPNSSNLWVKVKMTKCKGNEDQKFRHIQGGQIIHITSGKCLDASRSASGSDVHVSPCRDSYSQLWWFDSYFGLKLDVEPSL